MSEIAEFLSRVAKSPAVKFFVIGFLILLLLIPLLMVGGLVSEREGRSFEVRAEVARTWGGAQQIGGPFLVVPYTARSERKEGDKTIVETVYKTAVFMPEDLAFEAKTASEVLHRSIFDVNVYTATLSMEGRFLAPDVTRTDPTAIAADWRDARLVLVLSDVSGLKEAAMLEIDGAGNLPFEPSPLLPASNMSGIHVKLAETPSLLGADGAIKAFAFRASLAFTGSGTLAFAPAARETRLTLASDWPHPSFTGAFSPEERSLRDDGFTARWRVPHLARSVPQNLTPADAGIQQLAPYYFGVSFYQPVDFYDLVMRAVKYAVLFLAVTFMAVFVLELLSGRPVHAVQYLFVGLAMVFFYVLLLSLSEHIGFTPAYLAASAATGGMLSLYAGKVLDSMERGLAMLALFAVTYGLLYLILTLEDYALLAGALLGFAALTAVMFATLKVDWSAGAPPAPADRGS
jgi:inner membrane protein